MECDTWFLGWKLQRRCQERLVNRDQRWVTINKIAIPLKVCSYGGGSQWGVRAHECPRSDPSMAEADKVEG